MKRVREPLGSVRSSNEILTSAGPSSAGKDIANDRKRGRSDHVLLDLGASVGQSEHGSFRGLLEGAGVIWPADEGQNAGTQRRGPLLGFACRCNVSKLRLEVENALVHDRARQQDFLEDMRDFMCGPISTFHRALLPLECREHWSGGVPPRPGGGSGFGGGGSAILAAASVASMGSRSVNAIHESLAKVLLRVDCIQPQVIDMLLEKLPEIVAEEETDVTSGGSFAEDLPRLVLNQVRFLDHLVDSTALTQKLLECVTVLPLGLQREMISYLPEVVEDGEHASVVETLQDLKQSEPSLLVAILDALGNLSLPAHLLGTITTDALSLLESAEPATLPVLVRFLLETATSETAERVMKEIRAKLRLSPAEHGTGHAGCGNIAEDSESTEAPWFNSGTGGGTDSRSSGDALTLEAIRQGLRLSSDLSACFLRAIASTDGSAGHSAVDLWVLFCLHANQDTRKKVITLFRRKTALGHFTEALMSDALQGRKAALHGLFQSLLGIADALVSAGGMATRRYGASMYRAMFMEFSELYNRQEVVGALLTHAGAGCESETDCALTALSALARAPPDCRVHTLHRSVIHSTYREPRLVLLEILDMCLPPLLVANTSGGLRPFAAFIRGLLDYTQGFTHNQVRQVFRILCAMAAPISSGASASGGARGGNGVNGASSSSSGGFRGSRSSDLDDVHIFIRKHVALSQIAAKRIGIIGAVAFVEFQGRGGGVQNDRDKLSQDSAGGSAAGGGPAFSPGCPGADTLNMLLSHCKGSQEGRAFLYDELALSASTRALGIDARELLVDILSGPLEDDFLNVADGDDDEAGGGENGGGAPSRLPGGSRRRTLEDQRFREDIFEGAIKAKPFGELNDGMVCEVLLLPLLASADPQERAKVASLCPLFSLLATCHRADGNMFEVAATLGASMILADSQTVDSISRLEDAHKDAVIGAHLAACDWIRELMNAFVLEQDHDTQWKLIRRVGHLCRLEMDLLFMLRRHPGYRLPGASEGIKSKKAGGMNGKGGGKSGGGGKAPARSAKKPEGEILDTTRRALRGVMRQLSPEAVLILGFPAMLLKTRDTQGDTLNVEPIRVGLRGVHLLLQEVHGHLKRALAPGKITNPAFARMREAASSSGPVQEINPKPTRPALDLLNMYSAGGVFRSFRTLLEAVGHFLRGVSGDLEAIESDVDDEGMLIPCLQTALKVLSILCGSDELLGSPAGRDLLRRCLQDAFDGDADRGRSGGRDGQTATVEQSDGEPFRLCFDKLEDFACVVQQLPLAVELVQVMEVVATARIRFLAAAAASAATTMAAVNSGNRRREGTLSLHNELSTLCLTLLQKDWSDGDAKFVYKNSTLGVLVRAHLRWAQDPLEAVEVMSSEVLPLLLETGECLGPAEGYPTLTAASFSHFFTPLLEALVTCWKDRTEFFARPRLPTRALLLRAERMVLIFRLLVVSTRGNPTLSRRPVLISTLKEGKKFVQAFLRSISVMEQAFQEFQADILRIFGNLQQATRHMQSLCAHGKEIGDASMSKEAPVVKKLLEEFIFRVRSLVQSNDCLDALVVNNLKNRDIEGKLLAPPEEEPEDSYESQSEGGNPGRSGSESDSDSDSDADVEGRAARHRGEQPEGRHEDGGVGSDDDAVSRSDASGSDTDDE